MIGSGLFVLHHVGEKQFDALLEDLKLIATNCDARYKAKIPIEFMIYESQPLKI